MIAVRNTVPTYGPGRKRVPGLAGLLHVTSHPNYSDMVVLHFAETSITVAAADLIRAIENAVNTGRGYDGHLQES